MPAAREYTETMSIIIHIALVALALMGVAYIVPGISVDSFLTACIAAILIGILNVFVRPLLIILTLPVTIITFGLFVFVINALLFAAAAAFIDGFSVSGFLPALVGACLISIASTISWRLVR